MLLVDTSAALSAAKMHNSFARPTSSPSHPGKAYEPSFLSSVASPKGPLPPVMTSITPAPPVRPSSGLQMAHLLHPPAQPGHGMSMGHPQMGPGPGQQQKRAYRQRRKDPSCDACRERKVKCDASESTSCTECSNRKVRCQFTKETNRRMSSIKQVQDLEKQLHSTKQQLLQLRSGIAKSDSSMDLDLDPTSPSALKLPDVGVPPRRRKRPSVMQDMSEVRANIRNYGRGLLKVPPPYRQQDASSLLTSDPPSLPPKSVADRLLNQYYACVHSVLPIIHWPSFIADYEKYYHRNSLHGVHREWAAVLFGVFACGKLYTLEPRKVEDAKAYMQLIHSLTDFWRDGFSADQARIAVLLSIALYEMNSRSASWIWLGSAVRIAQDIGLHLESGPWSDVETEMRRRLWWGIYAWDRLLSLEMGKPLSISDQDCDVDLPCPVDDEYISHAGKVPDSHQTTPLLATIHVVRSISQLSKTLRTSVVSAATLETFDRHFDACLATFPPYHQPNSDEYLDPRALSPIMYLLNAQFVLHRHNISVVCPAEVRYPAFRHCVRIAQQTTRLLSRSMHDRPSSPQTYGGAGGGSWQSLLASSASTMLCIHILRCLLMLLFREEFASALICVQAAKTIGNARTVNSCCGRYTAFFLKCLLERYQRSDSIPLDRDEAMIAYVSADMQGTTDGAWIWQGSETGMQLESVGVTPRISPTAAEAESSGAPRSDASGKETEMEWEGWDWVEQTVQWFANEQQQRHRTLQESRDPSSFSPSSNQSGSTLGAPVNPNPSKSRMTIASII